MNFITQARHPATASRRITRRLLDSQLQLHGGAKGEQLARQFIYSRFRQAPVFYNKPVVESQPSSNLGLPIFKSVSYLIWPFRSICIFVDAFYHGNVARCRPAITMSCFCRHQRTIREAPQPRSCAYMDGGAKLLIGTNFGILQVHDADNACELVEEYGGHIDIAFRSKPVYRLQVSLISFLSRIGSMHLFTSVVLSQDKVVLSSSHRLCCLYKPIQL